MIAGIVASLEEHDGQLPHIIAGIAKIPNVEIGDFTGDAHRIPMTIDSPCPNTLEETTRLIQDCPGVAFVDIVFVHFEDKPERVATVTSERNEL
ncbi:hypothetical protein CA54_05390 [Symmachiella macrocystis]|uniref:Uncharacterized protein n=1 Tax=Symmachiella macrocystis TaxID=2527985 RepID=A0A5C6BIB2_9PLAN|nr:chaperone NapD [Symmachiella macrocystis]TWU11730.1 hypothetical protein CA54_05390 [Symmachiella macrocystis]